MDETTSINQMHLSTAKNRTATMEKTTAEEAVTALWSRADGSHIEQGHGLFATSGSDTTTSVDNHKTESSPLSTSARPPTTSASPTGSSTTSAGEKCPSGSVYLFDWCIPWWIFLITALILLFLLLCCLAWILHCCCKILVHRCQVKSTVINRRISTDHKGNQTEAEVFEGNGTKDLKAKKRISSNSDVVSFSGSEYQNAHCDYIPAPVEAAPIPVIFAPNDDGEKKSETKAAAIIRQATGTEISSAKGSDDHICSHEEVMAKMADISVAANRLSSEHESQNGDESKREFPLNPNSFEKNESVCDMANESTVTKRIRNKPFNEGSQESPRAEKEPPDVTKTNNYEKDAGNSQLMSPRRFPSPAPSLVQFSEPPPRMTIVNPEVASRSPRVSCAASQRGVSPKNRPVSRHFPNGIPLESPVHSDQEASNEAANRAMRKSTLSRLSSKVTPDITPPRFSIRSPAKIRKSPSPNPFLRRSHGIQGGVVSRNNAINPVAWKPWAKSLKSFSDNPGFLDDD